MTVRHDLIDAAVRAGHKINKADCDYGEGYKSAHCGICEHYNGHVCSIVTGYIEADKWCRYYEDNDAGEAEYEDGA